MPNTKKTKGGDFDSFKAFLLAKRDELQKRVDQQHAELSNDRDPDDEGAAAVWCLERDLTMTNLDRSTRTLSEVQAALRSIESGSYGICSRCEDRIADARLRAIPWTRLCLECAGGGIRHTEVPEDLPQNVRANVVASSVLRAAIRARARAK